MEKEYSFTYDENYLTIGAVRDNVKISFGKDLQFAIDGNYQYSNLPANTEITINAGQCISFKGNIGAPANDNDITPFVISGRCCLLGNCMSILYGDNAANNNEVPAAAFAYLFSFCSGIISVSENFLPATVLNASCYYCMFTGCTILKNAPRLPATTLADGCYYSMFAGCSFLQYPPALPATELTYYCYSNMFNGCGLKVAPELPALELKQDCYSNMFKECKKLKSTPKLNATSLANRGYAYMFDGCSSLEEASDLNAEHISNSCYTNMFANCIKLTTAPKIKATTVGESGCSQMFYNCTSLTTPPDLQSIKSLWTSCYSGMFKNCTSLEIAPILPVTQLYRSCYYGMFEGCTNLIIAPELPAQSFVEGCYRAMFKGCKNLRVIKMYIESGPKDLYEYCSEMTSNAGPGILVVSDTATWYVDNSSYFYNWRIYKLSDYEEAISSEEYLYIQAIDDGVSFMFDNDLEYSTDNLNSWNTLTSGSYSPVINSGEKIFLRALAKQIVNDSLIKGIGTFKFTNNQRFNVGGKVTSLIWNAGGIHVIPDYLCAYLFNDCKGLISAEDLIFPEDLYIGNNSCCAMFEYCSNLITAPRLDSKYLSSLSYQSMFRHCKSLINVFKLPATELKYGCYSQMFLGCSALTSAPELPALTLESPSDYDGSRCYDDMFNGCSSLKYIKAMFTTDPSTSNYTKNWVKDVALKGTFVKNSDATWSVFGVDGIPEGWTIEYADY